MKKQDFILDIKIAGLKLFIWTYDFVADVIRVIRF